MCPVVGSLHGAKTRCISFTHLNSLSPKSVLVPSEAKENCGTIKRVAITSDYFKILLTFIYGKFEKVSKCALSRSKYWIIPELANLCFCPLYFSGHLWPIFKYSFHTLGENILKHDRITPVIIKKGIFYFCTLFMKCRVS